MRISIGCFVFLNVLLINMLCAQADSARSVTGRWQVVRYSEQGLQVDKRLDPVAQAQAVYQRIKTQRTEAFYGYYADYWEGRPPRGLARWLVEDSIRETRRVAGAISLPYVAVFFPDSTLALYNLAPEDGSVTNVESWRYTWRADLRSIDVFPDRYSKWDVQVTELSPDRMVLFNPREAEVVELRRTPFVLP